LKDGVLRLENHGEKPFVPATIGEIWNMERALLPRALKLGADFPVVLEENISELGVLYDEESAPPQTRVFWDEEELVARRVEILDFNNTLFSIPAELLTSGAHRLRFESEATNSAEGFLERPILRGEFLIGDENRLRAMPRRNQHWNGQSWPQLGAPQGFGPHEYEFDFELNARQATQKWELHLPDCIGVAQVWVNDQEIGKSSWAPRVLPACGLREGENVVRVRLYGSWNNVLSNLNVLENGLRGEAKLIAAYNGNESENR
jgi:hypothetical protein